MSRHPFRWYELRTTHTSAAQAFYESVLGLPFRGTETGGVFFANGVPVLGLSRLPERATANGARPHWLGYLALGNVDDAVKRFAALGAEPLGPLLRDIEGIPFATMRDPFGAVVAMSARTGGATDEVVAWHQMHTTDRERAWSAYQTLCGWSARATTDLGADGGEQQEFAWDDKGNTVGAFANTALKPGVHVHWLFCFATADLDAATQTVEKHRGEVFQRIVLPNGDRAAACHDPQGAEFGLYAKARNATR